MPKKARRAPALLMMLPRPPPMPDRGPLVSPPGQ
jgi:hypothetical protein